MTVAFEERCVRMRLIFRESADFLFRRIGFETLVWISAFSFLAVHNPYASSDFSICPLENLGFHYCPGCGLGRAVSFLLHGDVVRSWHTHVLAIPATIILSLRIFSLLNKSLRGKLPQPLIP